MTVELTRTGENASGDSFTKRLITPDDGRFAWARVSRVYNGRQHEQQPAAILLAESEEDIVAGLKLATERDWQVSLRAGGHSYPMWGVREQALLIDLGGMKQMSYDDASGIVSVTPACEGGNDVNAYLRTKGRFFAGGLCASVGVGGFLLQGGLGWNFRGWGWACEAVAAVDVITAGGELVRADAEHHTDLYFSARGGGPGFPGIVVRFHIRTRPLPGAVLYTRQYFPLNSYVDVLEWLGRTNTSLSDRVHLMAMAIEPDIDLPGHPGGLAFVVWAVAFSDTVAEAIAALAPLTDNPHLDRALLIEPPTVTSIEAEYAFTDLAEPPGRRYRIDSAWVEGPTRAVADAARNAVAGRPGLQSGYTFFQFALPHEGPDMAASLRSELLIGAFLIYDDADDDERYAAWLLDAMEDLEPFTIGQYWGDSDQQHRQVKCLTDESWSRVQDARRRWDPSGRFVDFPAGPDGYRNSNGWQTPTLPPRTNQPENAR